MNFHIKVYLYLSYLSFFLYGVVLYHKLPATCDSDIVFNTSACYLCILLLFHGVLTRFYDSHLIDHSKFKYAIYGCQNHVTPNLTGFWLSFVVFCIQSGSWNPSPSQVYCMQKNNICWYSISQNMPLLQCCFCGMDCWQVRLMVEGFRVECCRSRNHNNWSWICLN